MSTQPTQDKKSSTDEPGSTAKQAPPDEVTASPSTLPDNPPSTGPYAGLTASEQAEKERVEAEERIAKATKEREAQQEKDAKEAQQAHDDAVKAQEERAKG